MSVLVSRRAKWSRETAEQTKSEEESKELKENAAENMNKKRLPLFF